MSGGKGGSSTSEVTIPEYIEEAARRNLNKAEGISQIGYTPYYGPDVAAFTPMQEAAFQNTANTANAFGMAAPTSQRDIMGGMAAPTEYAGGVRGYSSAPMYEESVAELGRQRPGQKEYIDSFFIDPRTGAAGSNMQPMIDYTQFNTMAQDARDTGAANRANDLAIAQAQAGAGPQYVSNMNLTQNELDHYENIIAPSTNVSSVYDNQTDVSSNYDSRTDILTPDQNTYVNNYAAPVLDMDPNTNEYANDPRLAQEDINASILGNANSSTVDNIKGIFNVEPSFDNPSSSGSYGGSLTTGSLSGDFTPLPGIAGNIADNVLSTVAPSIAIDQQGKEFAASGGSTYDPGMTITNPISGNVSSGGYDFDPTAFSSDYGGGSTTPAVTPAPATSGGYTSIADMFDGGGAGTSGDTFEGGVSAVSNVVAKPKGSSDNDDDGDKGGGGGCVVATHAVESGAFTPSMKREAVVWCMNVLHGKWWGEAIRRGYRHLGSKKIAQGKAREHYSEFRRYIAFARGKDRTFRGAITFTIRTAQFFAVGLVKRDA